MVLAELPRCKMVQAAYTERERERESGEARDRVRYKLFTMLESLCSKRTFRKIAHTHTHT